MSQFRVCSPWSLWGSVSRGLSLKFGSLCLDCSELFEVLYIKVLINVFGNLCLWREVSGIVESLSYKFWIWAIWGSVFRMWEHWTLWSSLLQDLRYLEESVLEWESVALWRSFFKQLILSYVGVFVQSARSFTSLRICVLRFWAWCICRPMFRAWGLMHFQVSVRMYSWEALEFFKDGYSKIWVWGFWGSAFRL